MARQMGHHPIKGTVDQLTFYYHPEDGWLVRVKSSFTAERILNDPNFQLFVDSGIEFGEAVFAGKLLRKSFQGNLFPIADGKLSSRMNAAMLRVVKSDPGNKNGNRRFHKGNAGLLKGFEFNIKLALDDVFTGDYVISRNKTSGELYIHIPGFAIASKITAPEHATHFRFIAARITIDFEQGVYRSMFGETIKMPLSQPVTEDLRFILPPKHIDGGVGFVLLGIIFSGELKKVPRNVISQRKRKRLKGLSASDGTTKFTGTLKVVKVEEPKVRGQKSESGNAGG